ncbi:MAG: RimK family alpha-L-glutamate ligase [Paenisporosarcina sp.]
MKGLLVYEAFEAVRNEDFIKRLILAAEQYGHTLQLVKHDEEEIPEADFVVFRARYPKLAKVLESKGMQLFNRAEVNVIANDKYKTNQMAALLGIPVVPTKKIRNIQDITSYPTVLKTVDGHGGQEVVLCQNEVSAREFISLHSERELIAQTFIESGSSDVRVFVIGDSIEGAVKRTGIDSFKSNVMLGGKAEVYELAEWQREQVIKIAQAVKSDYIGLDFLLLPDGTWLFNEMEDPVGARSYFMTTKKDIAVPIMAHIHSKLIEKEEQKTNG